MTFSDLLYHHNKKGQKRHVSTVYFEHNPKRGHPNNAQSPKGKPACVIDQSTLRKSVIRHSFRPEYKQ